MPALESQPRDRGQVAYSFCATVFSSAKWGQYLPQGFVRIGLIKMQSALNSAQHRESTVYVLATIISHGIILISTKAKDVCFMCV